MQHSHKELYGWARLAFKCFVVVVVVVVFFSGLRSILIVGALLRFAVLAIFRSRSDYAERVHGTGWLGKTRSQMFCCCCCCCCCCCFVVVSSGLRSTLIVGVLVRFAVLVIFLSRSDYMQHSYKELYGWARLVFKCFVVVVALLLWFLQVCDRLL